jgi:methylenetetrahydrofolate dehydrogenase (NADP+) / methenyltetrahydrofolate cyclohydrolase / formyltetrahydrofolate synthetase
VDSTAYIRMKRNAAQELGIAIKHITLPLEATIGQIISVVKDLNDDDTISGILVQLPLGPHIDIVGERSTIAAIAPQKDVDG